MKVLLSQSSQEYGSSGVSLFWGRDKLAQVGIGETVTVELPNGGGDLIIRCGSYGFKLHVDGHEPRGLEVAWDLGRAAMVIRSEKKEIGIATIF